MSKLLKPEGYEAVLNLKETELAIKNIKDFFLQSLSTELRLRRVTAPLFVLRGLGINDDLNGIERPVAFPIKDMNEATAEVVHSLAKWKRLTLAEYEVEPGFGIVTDMNAIRADEELDNIHSLYVDQWDWERTMTADQRNIAFLKKIVNKIYSAILRTEFHICETYPKLKHFLPEDVFFIHSEELVKMYPNMTPKEREHPEILNGSRKARIAKGSGTSIQEVNRLLKQFDDMRKMMKSVANAPKGRMPKLRR